MATLTFEKFENLSKSDFAGTVRVSKDADAKFRSFGVSYKGTMVWTADENWYKAWIAGTVIGGSITLQEEQRMTTKLDANGNPELLNGKKQYVPVEGEKNLVMVALKTKEQLSNEDELEVWEKTRHYAKKEKIMKAAADYNAAVVKLTETTALSAEKKAAADKMLADMGL